MEFLKASEKRRYLKLDKCSWEDYMRWEFLLKSMIDVSQTHKQTDWKDEPFDSIFGDAITQRALYTISYNL